MKEGRAVTTMLFIVAIAAPIVIMTDNTPMWPSPFLKYLCAAGVSALFFLLSVGYSMALISGRESEYERRQRGE